MLTLRYYPDLPLAQGERILDVPVGITSAIFDGGLPSAPDLAIK